MNERNRIAYYRRRQGLSQRTLADNVGMHWVTLSKLERGEMRLTQGYLEILSIALNVSTEELLGDRPVIRTVIVDGILGRKGIENNKDNMFADIEEFSTVLELDNAITSSWYFASEFLFDRLIGEMDLLRFAELPDLADEDKFGRFCLVEDADGEKFVGVLQRGADQETFDIETLDYARVSGLRPTSIKMLVMTIAFPNYRSSKP